MKYAVYFEWLDGFRDTFTCNSASDRDSNIKEMIARKEFTRIEYCSIYRSGEYGKRTKVL